MDLTQNSILELFLQVHKTDKIAVGDPFETFLGNKGRLVYT